VDQTYTKRSFEFGGYRVDVLLLESAATDYDLTGQVIWPAAWVLSKFILRNIELFSGKSVLEVGSGIGVTGLLASQINNSVCVLTDSNEYVMDILRQNVALNSSKAPSCSCMKLDWGNEGDMQNILQFQPSGFDVIIGSDVVFWQVSIIPLLQTVSKLLNQNHNSMFILCYQSRANNTDLYLLQIGQEMGFRIEEIRLDEFIPQVELEKHKNVKLLIFKKTIQNYLWYLFVGN